MIYEDSTEDTEQLSVEAQVALAMGDEDADELVDETPHWRLGGTRAKTSERDRLTFDTSGAPNREWEN